MSHGHKANIIRHRKVRAYEEAAGQIDRDQDASVANKSSVKTLLKPASYT